MSMQDIINKGTLNVGDCVKYTKSGNTLANAIVLQMQENGMANMELNEDKTEIELSIINTMLEMEDSVTKMNKEQVNHFIISLKELWKQM